MSTFWAFVAEADLPALLRALVEASIARFEVADNRGGNGQWLVTAYIYEHGGPKSASALPKVKGGWKGART